MPGGAPVGDGDAMSTHAVLDTGDQPVAAPPRLTRAEHEARERELGSLRAARDRELPGRMRDARTYVAADAAEEIGQIQVEQTVLDARIARLESLLARCTVVDEDAVEGVVTVGSTVGVLYQRSGRQATLRVTGVSVDGAPGAVSARSPIGTVLIGARPGDVVEARLPGGRTERLTVLSVEHPATWR